MKYAVLALSVVAPLAPTTLMASALPEKEAELIQRCERYISMNKVEAAQSTLNGLAMLVDERKKARRG